jgi:hypothetical protein
MLWAAGLDFAHPIDGRPIRLESPPPPKFAAFLAREAARWRKFHAAGGEGAEAGWGGEVPAPDCGAGEGLSREGP